MDRINALKMLIDHSYILYEHSKAVLKASLERMSEEDMQALERLLKKENKSSIRELELDCRIIEALVDKFEEE